MQCVSAAEVAVQCGPSVLLLQLDTGKQVQKPCSTLIDPVTSLIQVLWPVLPQRVLGSIAWTGIQSFAASAKGGVLAVALKVSVAHAARFMDELQSTSQTLSLTALLPASHPHLQHPGPAAAGQCGSWSQLGLHSSCTVA